MLPVFSAREMAGWDAWTIAHEPIASIDLMERAAWACTNWLRKQFPVTTPVCICCGPGNNGGDGLAIARMLHQEGYAVNVVLLASAQRSPDGLTNLTRLPEGVTCTTFNHAHLPQLVPGTVVIDALFGTGLSRPLEGDAAQLVNFINHSGADIVAIDVPSGLQSDRILQEEGRIVRATFTLTFQAPKLAYLFPENEQFVGKFHILNIGLLDTYPALATATRHYITPEGVGRWLHPRTTFAHKGNFGHALLVAGSSGFMGAALLAAKACLRSGAGLLTVHLPAAGVETMNTALPEAMTRADVHTDRFTFLDTAQLPPKINALGIGPGLGTHTETVKAVRELLPQLKQPVVLDADALNAIAGTYVSLPPGSILTPHPGEFDRLAGASSSGAERMEKLTDFARTHTCVVVLKGAHTCVCTPDGHWYFNSTGNPGLAKGGSGDVLTGVILALLAQQYTTLEAAVLGVLLHGLAADVAVKTKSAESLLATDVIEALPEAFRLTGYRNRIPT